MASKYRVFIFNFSTENYYKSSSAIQFKLLLKMFIGLISLAAEMFETGENLLWTGS
jgi:hypothetical protein